MMTAECMSSKVHFYHILPDGVVLKDIAVGAGGLGFDSRSGLIGNHAAKGSPPL